jgi:nucleoside phosphorylase
MPSVDILLYVALNEEFNATMEMLGEGFKPEEQADVALTCFFGSIPSSALGRDFQVAVVPAGKMGNTRSANVVSAMIEKLKPFDVVVLGIAGSLTNDLEPGDVFIPDSVNEYLANSATRGEDKAWSFQTSGNQFQTSARLLNRFQMFEHTQKSHYTRWRNDAAERRNLLIEKSIQEAINSAGLVMRGDCRLYAGEDRKLASGPAVGQGRAFLEWLTSEVDRKVAAMEMESAGVYDAATIRTPVPRTIAIRGISDYADARKKIIETSAKGRFRELAAKNALSLLLRGIEAGLFQSDSTLNTPAPLDSEDIEAISPENRGDSTVHLGFSTSGVYFDTDTDAPICTSVCIVTDAPERLLQQLQQIPLLIQRDPLVNAAAKKGVQGASLKQLAEGPGTKAIALRELAVISFSAYMYYCSKEAFDKLSRKERLHKLVVSPLQHRLSKKGERFEQVHTQLVDMPAYLKQAANAVLSIYHRRIDIPRPGATRFLV